MLEHLSPGTLTSTDLGTQPRPRKDVPVVANWNIRPPRGRSYHIPAHNTHAKQNHFRNV